MLKVLEVTKKKIKLEIEDTHTFLNILKEELWNEKSVKIAAYTKPHPYLGQPILLVRGSNLKKALQNTAKRIANQAKQFRVEFSRKLKAG